MNGKMRSFREVKMDLADRAANLLAPGIGIRRTCENPLPNSRKITAKLIEW